MRNVRFLLIPVLFVCVLLLAGCVAQPQDVIRPQTAASAPASATPADRAAIERVLIGATNDDVAVLAAKLSLEQVALDSGYALATWSRGDAAGQALLRRQGDAWTVLAHDQGWMGIRGLSREGVPGPVARRLLDQIDPNWATYEQF
jgi:hypothetical protein